MSLREKIENNIGVIILSVLLVGYSSGVSTMVFIDSMEERIHDRIVETLEK